MDTLRPLLQPGVTMESELNLRRILIFVKLTFFLYVGGRSVFVSFIVVFFAYIGLNPAEIGIIRGIQPFICFIFSPLIGMLSDRTGIHKQVILLGTAGMGLSYLSIAFLAEPDRPASTVVTQSSNDGIVPRTQSLTTAPIGYSSEEARGTDHMTVSRSIAPSGYYGNGTARETDHRAQFLGSIALIALGELCNVAVLPILDSNTKALARLSPSGSYSYGQQRLWGSIGAMVFLSVTGYTLDLLNRGVAVYHDYFPGFLIYLACIAVSMVMWFWIPVIVEGSGDADGGISHTAHMKAALGSRPFMMFLLVAFVLGVTAAQDTAKYLFLADLGATHSNRSLCIVFNCLGEIPLMWYSKGIIDRLRAEVVFCLVIVAWVIRLGAYSFLVNPWLILPVELLNGVCFGLWWPAVMEFCNEATQPGFVVSILAVANAVFVGIGPAVGSLLGGFLYEALGPRMLFRGVAGMNLLLLAVYMTFLRFRRVNKIIFSECVASVRTPIYSDGGVEYRSTEFVGAIKERDDYKETSV